MNQYLSVVLERVKHVTGPFATEPYETGWATEATFYVDVHAPATVPGLIKSRVQISPDGFTWADEGHELVWPKQPGVAFVRVLHFGGWLRLITDYWPENTPETSVTITLALKG